MPSDTSALSLQCSGNLAWAWGTQDLLVTGIKRKERDIFCFFHCVAAAVLRLFISYENLALTVGVWRFTLPLYTCPTIGNVPSEMPHFFHVMWVFSFLTKRAWISKPATFYTGKFWVRGNRQKFIRINYSFIVLQHILYLIIYLMCIIYILLLCSSSPVKCFLSSPSALLATFCMAGIMQNIA